MRVWIEGTLGLLLAGGIALAQEAVPVGDEFQVNSYTTQYQYSPSAATGADGDFVVVWTSYGSYGTDTSQGSVQLRRFTSDGTPVSDDIQVNIYTTSSQNQPSVAIDSDGNLVVVWQSIGSFGTDGFFYSVQGQRFDPAGDAVGGQFQVNTYTTSYQGNPSRTIRIFSSAENRRRARRRISRTVASLDCFFFAGIRHSPGPDPRPESVS
jgi:hypothetical protein